MSQASDLQDEIADARWAFGLAHGLGLGLFCGFFAGTVLTGLWFQGALVLSVALAVFGLVFDYLFKRKVIGGD